MADGVILSYTLWGIIIESAQDVGAVLLLAQLLCFLALLVHLVLDDLFLLLYGGFFLVGSAVLGCIVAGDDDCFLLVFLQVLCHLGSLFDLFLLDIDDLLVVLVPMFLPLIIHNGKGLIHLHLLQLQLHLSQGSQEFLTEKLAIFHFGDKRLHVFEILKGFALIHGVIFLSTVDPALLLVQLGMHNSLGEQSRPGL